MSKEKLTLYADIIKETASIYESTLSALSLPPEELRQPDLQYILAVLVSSGMNLNGAVFLPTELIHARDTMLDKPLDVEHMEGFVVGHIYGRAFMKKDRTPLDPMSMLMELGPNIDKEDMDIAVAMTLYKNRFPDIAEEVAVGKYKVSMECYYSSFALKIGDVIVSQDEASKLGLRFSGPDSHINKWVKLTEGSKEIGQAQIGRVLKNIRFAGCGLVEIPANPDSVVIDTAALTQGASIMDNFIIDMSRSDTYMKTKQQDQAIEVPVVAEPVVETPAPEVLPKSITIDTTPDVAVAGSPASSRNPGTCVSFKKEVYEYLPAPFVADDSDSGVNPPILNPTGLGDSLGPDDKIIHEHWCSLFDEACPTLAGEATHPTCLRNVLERTTKEVISNMEDLHESLDDSQESSLEESKVVELLDNLKKAIGKVGKL